MNLQFACPHCAQSLEGDVPPQGSETTCPGCGNLFRIGAFVPEVTPVIPRQPAVSKPRVPQSPMSTSGRRRVREQHEEARGRLVLLGAIVGATLVISGIVWLSTSALSWRSKAKVAEEENQGAENVLRQAKVKELERREQEDEQKKLADGVVRENTLIRIRAQKEEFIRNKTFAKIVLSRNVFEGDSGMAEEMLGEMEKLYDEAVATHTDATAGNEIYDAPAYMQMHLMERLAANARIGRWIADRSAAEFWRRFSKSAPEDRDKDGNRPLPDFLASGKYSSSGTGFWISPDGWLLTNYHVTGKAAAVDIRTADGKILPAKVEARDEKNDIALIKADIRPGGWVPLSRGEREPGIGEHVFTVGFPNTHVQGVAAKFSPGQISSGSGLRDDRNFFQTNVPALPGNSGGALVHTKTGWVVGMVTLKLTAVAGVGSVDNVSYALKSSVIHQFVRSHPAAAGIANLKSELSTNPQEREVISRTEKATALILVE